MSSVYEKMTGGELYCCSDENLMHQQQMCLEKLYDFNATRPSQGEERTRLLQEMFAEIGEGCYIEPPLRANWGGRQSLSGDARDRRA